MFTKKQFITLLGIAVVIFLIFFTAFYTVSYRKGLEESIVNPNALIETFEGISDIDEVSGEVEEDSVITPDTRITLKVLDQNDLIVEQQEISSMSLLGKNSEELLNLFKGYELEHFTDKEVILTKTMYVVSEAPSYKLGVEGDEIGIVVGGSNPAFISLNLYTKDFSSHTVEILKEKAISLTIEQKNRLEKDAYYIEEILQNYNE